MMALQYSCRGCSDLCCQIRNKLFCHSAKVCMGMPSSFAVRLTLSSFSLTLVMASALKLSLYSTLFLVMVNSCLGCQFTKYFLPFFSAYINNPSVDYPEKEQQIARFFPNDNYWDTVNLNTIAEKSSNLHAKR